MSDAGTCEINLSSHTQQMHFGLRGVLPVGRRAPSHSSELHCERRSGCRHMRDAARERGGVVWTTNAIAKHTLVLGRRRREGRRRRRRRNWRQRRTGDDATRTHDARHTRPLGTRTRHPCHPFLHSVHRTPHTAHCTARTSYTPHTAYRIPHTAHRTPHTTHFLHTAHNTPHTTHRTPLTHRHILREAIAAGDGIRLRRWKVFHAVLADR